MNVLKRWLENNRGQGRQDLLTELRKVYPRITSTSLSQYATGGRIPEKGKAEIIARFIGMPLEAIPFRMVNKPSMGTPTPIDPARRKITTPNAPDNGGGEAEPKPSFFQKLKMLASN